MKNEIFTLLNKTFLLIFSCTLLSVSVTNAQKQTENISKTEISLTSDALDEVRNVSIYLPENYDLTTQKYPVLYLLDGNTHFQHAIGAVDFLSNMGIMPQLIIVAIQNVDRNRDFSPTHEARIPTSGGAEKFLEFVSDELITYISQNYRASNYKIIMGHSFGGTFVTYSLLTKPNLFDAYIAISPYIHYDDNYLVKEARTALKPNYNNHKYFYMSVGNEPAYFSALEEFSSLIKEKSSKSIDFEYSKWNNENHATIPYLSLYNGLKFIFSDWQLPLISWQLALISLDQGMLAIDEHYKNTSAKYNIKLKTPENIMNTLGYRYMQKKDFKNAIKIFSENVKRYPKSPNVYDSLGEAYETNNQLKLAKKNYQKAYDLGIEQHNLNTSIYQNNLNRIQ